jgi:hypothetical protein
MAKAGVCPLQCRRDSTAPHRSNTRKALNKKHFISKNPPNVKIRIIPKL